MRGVFIRCYNKRVFDYVFNVKLKKLVENLHFDKTCAIFAPTMKYRRTGLSVTTNIEHKGYNKTVIILHDGLFIYY